MEFDRYDNGRLAVVGVSVDFPDVSDQWVGQSDVIAPVETDLGGDGLFQSTTYRIEANGLHYRVWRLTRKGRIALKAQFAA